MLRNLQIYEGYDHEKTQATQLGRAMKAAKATKDASAVIAAQKAFLTSKLGPLVKEWKALKGKKTERNNVHSHFYVRPKGICEEKGISQAAKSVVVKEALRRLGY